MAVCPRTAAARTEEKHRSEAVKPIIIPHLGSADRGQAEGGPVLTAAELRLLLTKVLRKVNTNTKVKGGYKHGLMLIQRSACV